MHLSSCTTHAGRLRYDEAQAPGAVLLDYAQRAYGTTDEPEREREHEDEAPPARSPRARPAKVPRKAGCFGALASGVGMLPLSSSAAGWEGRVDAATASGHVVRSMLRVGDAGLAACVFEARPSRAPKHQSAGQPLNQSCTQWIN